MASHVLTAAQSESGSNAEVQVATLQTQTRYTSGMAAKSFTVSLPAHILATFGWDESEASRRISEMLVMELLRLNRLTEAEAAAMLGLDRWALLDVMAAHHVPAVSLSPDEWNAERTRSLTGVEPQ